jgi:uncharacterized protein
MIIYGTGELKQSSSQQYKAKCPQCGSFEVDFHFFKKYVHLFWVPTFPYGSRHVAHCVKCNCTYQESIPESIQSDLERARATTFFPWHIFSGTVLLVLGISAIIYFSDGKTKHYYPSGKLQAEGEYVNQKPEGKWTYWFENGTIQSEQNFLNGLEEGDWTWYNEQGIKIKSGGYHNGRYHGKWTFYSETGVLMEETLFKDNRKQGISTVYFEDGKKAAEGNFNRDREQGKWTYWHATQIRSMEGEFDDGERSGIWKFYFDDGKLESEIEFKDSLTYFLTLFDRDGNQLVKNGNGTFTDFYEDGQKESEGNVRQGLRTGQWSFWYPDGKMKEIGVFNYAAYVMRTSFDPDGKVMVLNGNGYHKVFYDDGIVARECLYRNGKAHGLMLTRTQDGATSSEVNYVDGKYEGESKYFHPEGGPLSTGSFRNNLQHGLWTWYHINGKKESEVSFTNGFKEGEQIFWSEAGEIVKREHYKKGKLTNEEAY